MTLPGSGTISFNAINIELGLSGTANKSINDANYRTLAGVSSGTIDLQDFHGKSNEVLQDTQTVVATYKNQEFGDPKAPTYTQYYGHSSGITPSSSVTDGTSNMYSGATINGIYWEDFLASVAFQLIGTYSNSGWTRMKVTHTFSGTVTSLLRASATFSSSGGSTQWIWSSSNIFSNVTSGQNSYVCEFFL